MPPVSTALNPNMDMEMLLELQRREQARAEAQAQAMQAQQQQSAGVGAIAGTAINNFLPEAPSLSGVPGLFDSVAGPGSAGEALGIEAGILEGPMTQPQGFVGGAGNLAGTADSILTSDETSPTLPVSSSSSYKIVLLISSWGALSWLVNTP